MKEQLYDVVAVSIEESTVRIISDRPKTIENALAIVAMAVSRRGVDEEFFAEVPTGAYKPGDRWQGKEQEKV